MQTGNLNLDNWQREILEFNGNLLLCTGRQVGKTTIFAIKSAEYLVSHPNAKIIVVSLTEDQAKLIIVMILDYLQKHHKDKIAKGTSKPTQNKIIMKNKASVIARPVGNTGDAVRGFTGDILIIDEASRMAEYVFTSSKPTLLTTAGQIWMCSTPHGKKGYFYECFLNKNERFKVFHISSEEVINERPISTSWTETQRAESIKFLQEEKKDMGQIQYGQEYLGLFLDELRQYFSDELIERTCTLKRNIPYPKENNYMGVDIARMGNDAITYEFIHKYSNVSYGHIENIVKHKQFTTKTEEDIIYLNSQLNPVKIGIDAGSGSLGVGLFDRFMINPIMKRKVIPMNNRAISLDKDGKKKQRIFKEDMYENMLNMMEKGEIHFLKDEDVLLSLRSVQWELVEFKGVTRVKIFGNDTHIVEGLVRALWLAKKEKDINIKIYYI